MKKLISLTLAFAMLFAIAVPSYATNKDVNVEVLEKKEDDNGTYTEFSKIGDFYYYFERNNNEIISISLAPNGNVDKYVRSTDSNEVQHYISNGNLSNFSTISDLNFELIETYVADIRKHENTRSNMFDEIRDLIYARLESLHGPTYIAQLRAMEQRSGTFCHVYETYTQSVIDHGVAYFTKGVTLASIVASSGLSITHLLDLWGIPNGTGQNGVADGIIDWTTNTLLTNMSVGTFTANAMFTQFANINNTTYYSAGKTIRHFGGYFYNSVTIGSSTLDYQHSYYNDFDNIIEMAFYYYMGY